MQNRYKNIKKMVNTEALTRQGEALFRCQGLPYFLSFLEILFDDGPNGWNM